MPASRNAAVALGGLMLLSITSAWGRAGPPAGVAPAATDRVTTAVIPPLPADAQTMDPAAFGRYYGIVRDNDADLDCPQLNAELQSLGTEIAHLPPQPDWAALSDEMRPKVNPNVAGAGHMVASAALSRVPLVGGLLAAVSERPPWTAARNADRMARFQQAQQASMSHAVLHARRARVTGLFRDRGCRVADFDPPPQLEEPAAPVDTGNAAAASPVTVPDGAPAAPSKSP
jgi:hypothetical protein